MAIMSAVAAFAVFLQGCSGRSFDGFPHTMQCDGGCYGLWECNPVTGQPSMTLHGCYNSGTINYPMTCDKAEVELNSNYDCTRDQLCCTGMDPNGGPQDSTNPFCVSYWQNCDSPRTTFTGALTR